MSPGDYGGGIERSMAIQGDLLSADLSNIFQMLALNQKRGVLKVRNQGDLLEHRALFLDGNRISLLDLPENRDMGAILLKQGRLDYDAYLDVVQKSRNAGGGTAEFFRVNGILDEADILAAEKQLQEELILEIFLWQDVSFSLDEEMEVEEDPNREFFVVDLIVLEAARRQDEWNRVNVHDGVTSDIHVPVAEGSRAKSAENLDDSTRLVFDLVDGIRGTSQIVDASGLPRYHVMLALGSMVDQQLVRPLEVEELVREGNRLVDDGRFEDGIRLHREVLRFERRRVDIHERLSSAYLAVGRPGMAASHERIRARILLKGGAVKEALAVFQHVAEILPTDFRSIERSVELLVRIGEPLGDHVRSSLELGHSLFRFYNDSNFDKRGEKILRNLILLQPDETGLQVALARILARTERTDEAVEVYMEACDLLLESGDHRGARALCRTAVSLETRDKPVCIRKIAEIEGLMEQKRRSRTARLALAASLLILLSAGIGYGFHHNMAEDALVRIQASQDPVGEGAWRARAGLYEGVSERYPLTRASFEAGRMSRKANEQADEQMALDAALRRRAEEESLGIFETARLQHAEGFRLQLEADLVGALNMYRAALENAGKSGRIPWSKSPGILLPAKIAALETHLNGENRAVDAALEALDTGSMQRAFELARSVLGDNGGKELDAGRIKVLGHHNRDRLQIPFHVQVSPTDAVAKRLDGTSFELPGHVVLSAGMPCETLSITRPGCEPVELELVWDRSRYRQEVILKRRSGQTSRLGTRIVGLASASDGVLATLADGTVVLSNARSLEEVWRNDISGLFEARLNSVVVDETIVTATAEGRVRGLDLATGATKWRHILETGEVHEMVASGSGVFVVSGAFRRHVVALDLHTGNRVWSTVFPKGVDDLGIVGDTVHVLQEGHALSFLSGGDGTLMRTISGRFGSKAVAAVGGVYVLEAPDHLRCISPDGGEEEQSWDLPSPAVSGPHVVGRRVLLQVAGGVLLDMEPGGQPVVIPGIPRERLNLGSVRVSSLGEHEALLHLEGGGALHVHMGMGMGRSTGLYSSPEGSGTHGVLVGDRIVVCSGNQDGKLDAYARPGSR